MRFLPSLTKRRAVAVVATTSVLAGLGAGGAYAYFSSNSAGTGSGTTGTLQPVTVVAFIGGDSPTTMLVPNGTGDVIMRANNQNSYNVSLVGITAGSISVDGGHSASCAASNLTFNNPTNLPLTLTPGTTLYHLSGAATLAARAPNGCQGATFAITFSSFQVKK